NHYELLALPRSASTEDVTRAYREALALFRVCYSVTDEAWADALRGRAEQSLPKLSDAYTVLSNYGKRVEYDNLNSGRRIRPINVDIPMRLGGRPGIAQPSGHSRQVPFIRDPRSVVLPGRDEQTGDCIAARTSPYSVSRKGKGGRNRRRAARSWLSIP